MGGYRELLNNYLNAKPSIIREGNWTAKPECYLPRLDSFHIFRNPITGDLPWPGIVFGVSISSLYYWCSNQVIRHFAAEVTALGSWWSQMHSRLHYSLCNCRQLCACPHVVVKFPFQSLFIAQMTLCEILFKRNFSHSPIYNTWTVFIFFFPVII